jgi:ribosomal protein S18 acetylase RimI-like enzyme
VDVVTKTVLDREELDLCWEFYERAFDGFRDRSATRHSWTRAEFDAMMGDPRVNKLVVPDPEKDGRPCGLSTLTNILGAVPWVSPEFYAARWPQHFAQDKIWYVPFVAVDPARHRAGVLSDMVRAMVAVVPDDGGVLATDTCSWIEEALNLSDTLARLGSSDRRAPAKVLLDTQAYWGYEFASSI